MRKAILRRANKDEGESIISAVIVIPLVLMLLITSIDFTIYMSNRAQIQGIARDGARTVAIMGGSGDALRGTPIEVAYGNNIFDACNDLIRRPMVEKAYTPLQSSVIECNVMSALSNSTGFVNVTINEVDCGPTIATFIGQRVGCTVEWQYGGIPGSVLSFVRVEPSMDADPALGRSNTTSATAESEVNLSGQSLQNRINIGSGLTQ